MKPSPHANWTRPAACAGRFYPGNPPTLRREVRHYLATAAKPADPVPKALIAPHAGYIYSAPVAAAAFAHWTAVAEPIRRVVLIGPSHYAAFDGLARSSAEAFATPLGSVRLDPTALETLNSLRQVTEDDAAHEPEHCLEVELPFLQEMLGDCEIVPLLAGDAGDEVVAEVLEALWGGPETRILISSDLSHFHDYRSAQAIDAETARAIEEFDPKPIDGDHACGCLPIRGLLRVARHRRMRVRTIDLRNSGDTAGPHDRVVGYGAFAFWEP